jgi:hypothetical protein
MVINKKFKIKHEILELLLNKSQTRAHERDFEIHTSEIFKQLKKYKEDEVWKGLAFLTNRTEIGCNEKGRDSNFYILAKGEISYFERTYLELGEEKWWTITFNKLKTISTFILLIFAVYTFIANLTITSRNSNQLEKTIDSIKEIKLELEKIKSQQEIIAPAVDSIGVI